LFSIHATTTAAAAAVAAAAMVTSNDTHESHAVDWTDTVDDYYKTTILRRWRFRDRVVVVVRDGARVHVWEWESVTAAVTGRDNYNYCPFLDGEWCASARERMREKENVSEREGTNTV